MVLPGSSVGSGVGRSLLAPLHAGFTLTVLVLFCANSQLSLNPEFHARWIGEEDGKGRPWS